MFQSIKSKWSSWKKGLGKVRFSIGSKIKNLFVKKWDEATFDALEQLLFESDLGASLSCELAEKVKKLLKKDPSLTAEKILSLLREELLTLFTPPPLASQDKTPHVIMVVGTNGSGKTTSVAKLASFFQKKGEKTLIVAADTFRAAAIEQLTLWAKKIGCDITKSQPGSDPASVVFDSLSSAQSKQCKKVLIDTAGRLHTKTDLMKELEKVRTICKRFDETAPHETLLIIDATTGQNALDQVEIFHRYTPISGIILTKLDGTAKGGIVIAIQKKFNIPVLWTGLGESVEDLAPFQPEEFVDALLRTDS